MDCGSGMDGLRAATLGLALILVWAVGAGGGPAAASGTIRGSKHDLSVGGEGPVTATSEQQVCVFCHVPHRASGPTLANRRTSDAVYVTYASSTVWGSPPQPGGSSTLCLGCHDGTIALGDLGTGTLAMANTGPGGVMPVGPSLLGADLGDDHPVSLTIPAGRPGLNLPPPGDPVRLDAAGRIQCTSCHDPHDPGYPPFLVKSQETVGGLGGALCLTCHSPAGWADGAHANATATPVPLSLARRDPPETVSQAACGGCHRTHQAEDRARLGRGTPAGRCLACHDGRTAADVAGELALASHHPVGDGRHDPTENLRALPVTARHAECADCHQPHAATRTTARPGPTAPESLRGVGGVSAQYVAGAWSEPSVLAVGEVVAEYQICFKCHSGWSYGLTPPVSPSRRAADGVSAPVQTSPALAFHPLNGGGHATVTAHSRAGTGAPGAFCGTDRSGTVWSWDSILLCTDCHGPGLNHVGPAGPHGSTEGFLLRGPWVHAALSGAPVAPATGTWGTTGHLCFQCHDSGTYLDGFGTNTGFRSGEGSSMGANLHGGIHHQAACTACHAGVPHGFRNRALLVETTDPYPYNAGARVTYPHDLRGSPILPPVGSWRKADCQTACHQGR